MMNKKYDNIFFVFHTTTEYVKKIQKLLLKEGLKNCGAISDEKIKSEILKSSIFAVAKSGTISLEICNAKVPSIVIYKMNFINFIIVKMLVKVKFANIINISANKEIIPELLQSKCNSKNIYNTVDKLLSNKDELEKQILAFQIEINNFKTENPSKIASSILINHF
jgi:lipid-A-disaccharide synthase